MKKILMTGIICSLISASSFSQIEEQKILPSDGSEKDNFGMSVSITDNYAFIGSPLSNDSAGAVYVFRRDGSIWIESQKLIASDGLKGDGFGGQLSTIALSGDNLIIGAPFVDSSKGAAYIFRKEGLNWVEEKKIEASDGVQGDLFGISVSIAGEYAVIGSLNNDSSGSVYIFKHEETNWIEQNKLQPNSNELSYWFGMSVSISGDYLIVGAPYYKGSAYVFRREGADWIREQKLSASGNDTLLNYYGVSVSIVEDYAIVGSPGSFINGNHSGAVYIYLREDSSWIEIQKIYPSDGMTGDWFGISVSTSDAYILIGAHQDDDNGTSSGSAYLYRKTELGWNEEQKLVASDSNTGDIFGFSVSVSGEFIIVGAPSNDDLGESSGSAYVYHGFAVDVENEQTESSLTFRLEQNYPNPFNPGTKISWQVPVGSWQTLKIYDVLGNEVATLVDEYKPAGSYEVEFDISSISGSVSAKGGYASGVYFYQLRVTDPESGPGQGFMETKKMILVK